MLGGGAGQSVGGYSARVEPAVPIMGVMSRVVILVAAGSTQCACVVSEASVLSGEVLRAFSFELSVHVFCWFCCELFGKSS